MVDIQDAASTYPGGGNHSYQTPIVRITGAISDVLLDSDTIQSYIDTQNTAAITSILDDPQNKLQAYRIIKQMPVDLIEQILPQLTHDSLLWILNNFHGKLPGGYQYNFFHQQPEQLEQIKQTKEAYSDRYNTVTLSQFYQDVERAVQSNGGKDQHIDTIVAGIQDPRTPTKVDTKSLLPIYINLRNMGYGHQELAE